MPSITPMLIAFAATTVQQPVLRDSGGVRIVAIGSIETLPMRTAATNPTLTLGTVVGHPAYEFTAVVAAVRLSNGSIVVADGLALELRYFDAKGAWIRSAGGRGGGPGEFQDLTLVRGMAGDSVLAYDMRAGRVSFFDAEGTFGGSLRLVRTADHPIPHVRARLTTGHLVSLQSAFPVGAVGPARTFRDTLRVFLYTSQGDSVFAVLPVVGPDVAIIPRARGGFQRGYQEFSRAAVVDVVGASLVTADTEAWQLRLWTPTGQLREIWRASSSVREVAPADVRALREAALSRLPANRRAARQTYYARLPAPRGTMPALGTSLLVTMDGDVWVPTFRGPRDRLQTWTVVRRNYSVVTVTLPAAYELLDAGRDYILVRHIDESDVQFVVMYRLEP